MKVVFVRDSKNAGYTVLGINSGEGAVAYTVPTPLYMRIGAPLPSDVLGEESFSEAVFADEVFRAEKKALSLLAYSDNNRKTLLMKLKKAGFSHEAAEECVEDMLRHGYINEERQLQRLILSEAKTKLSGRAKYTPKLVAKGYKKSDIDRVTDELVSSGELDFDKIKRELVGKKLGDEPELSEVKKLLYKNGFGSDYGI